MNNGSESLPAADASPLLSETPSMSVAESQPIRSSLAIRLLRSTVAAVAISGIGYAALAASPELNKSFTQMTGLSIVQPAGSMSSGGCGSCSSSGEMAASCSGRETSMVPYAADGATCCPASGGEEALSLALPTCCTDGVDACCEGHGECPGACAGNSGLADAAEVTASDEAVASEVTTATTADGIESVVSEYLDATESTDP